MNPQAQNAFAEKLLKNDSDTLYEMRRQIESLIEHPGWEFVMDLVESRIAGMRLQMETGLHLHPEYTAFIGELRGMRVAQYAADAVLQASALREEQDRQLLAQMASKEN